MAVPETPPISWSEEKYGLGIAALDQDHQRLVDLINAVQRGAAAHLGTAFLEKVLADLSDYVATHFAREEGLMRQYGYPEFSAHKAAHGQFIVRIAEMKARLGSGKLVTGQIHGYLKDWLVLHILGMDRQYAPYLRERGVR